MDCQIDLKDLIGWIITASGFAIGIWQFIVQMKADRKKLYDELSTARLNKEKENKTTWFLNVIVLPHLEMIHNFYDKTTASLIEKQKSLKNYSKVLPHDDYINLRATSQNEIKLEITAFFDFLNPLVTSYSQDLGAKVQDVKNQLEDIIARTLETENLNEWVIKIQISDNKQNLLQLLNSEMSINV